MSIQIMKLTTFTFISNKNVIHHCQSMHLTLFSFNQYTPVSQICWRVLLLSSLSEFSFFFLEKNEWNLLYSNAQKLICTSGYEPHLVVTNEQLKFMITAVIKIRGKEERSILFYMIWISCFNCPEK